MTTQNNFSVKIENSQILNAIQNISENTSSHTLYGQITTAGGTPYNHTIVDVDETNITNHITFSDKTLSSYAAFILRGEKNGNNTGGNLSLLTYTDSGEIKSDPLTIERSTDKLSLNGPVFMKYLSDNINGNITSTSTQLDLTNTETFAVSYRTGFVYGLCTRIGNNITIYTDFIVTAVPVSQAPSYSVIFNKPINLGSMVMIKGFNGTIVKTPELTTPLNVNCLNINQNNFTVTFFPPEGYTIVQGNSFKISFSFCYSLV